ncbi:carboxypeptidase-like regulatory domain-containing protein [Neolewinella antarctica]|uniref:Uncharacterized protein n=1 Tax=Neolewinella antarctica TaxID=442734 RepID=A0ABX0X720_9BACT|nr:carboxypeptidase-like regulatory domain-containing protein [Neolewinella antarctica]NJC24663.1 hypothetical protein [Neolewinella antarctica]
MYPQQSLYPHFTANQVLSDGDLNQTFAYLYEQQRLTRSHLIGVGIVCGLRAKLITVGDKPAFTISSGCGVTTEGQLILHEDDAAQWRFVEPYDPPGGSEYFQLSGTPVPLWELTTRENNDNESLSDNFLRGNRQDGGMALLLFRESRLEDNRNCDRTNCDEKGETVLTAIRPLLLRRRDLAEIMRNLGGEASEIGVLHGLRNQRRRDSPVLERLRLARVRLGEELTGTTATVLRAFQRAITEMIDGDTEQKVRTLEKVAGVLSGIDRKPIDLSRLKFLSESEMLAGAHALDLPYYYDHLRHFVAAYEELRYELERFTRVCLPDSRYFPHHVVLHDIRFPTLSDAMRTPWISSPAGNNQVEAKRRIGRLHERLVDLTESVDLRRPPNRLTTVFDVRNTATVNVSKIDAVHERMAAFQPLLKSIGSFRAASRFNVARDYTKFKHTTARVRGATEPIVGASEVMGPQPAGKSATATVSVSAAEDIRNMMEALERASVKPGKVVADMEETLADLIKMDKRDGAAAEELIPFSINPSSLTTALSQRALPVYYNSEALINSWNDHRTHRGQGSYLAGFNAASFGGDTRALDYEMAPHQFLRIEGAIGQSAELVRRRVAMEITQRQLPLDLVVLSAGTDQRAVLSATSVVQFADLETAYLAQSHDMLGDLVEVLVRIYDLPQRGEGDGDGQLSGITSPTIPSHPLFSLLPEYRVLPGTVGALKEAGVTPTTGADEFYGGLADRILEVAAAVPATLVAYGGSGFSPRLLKLMQAVRESQTALINAMTPQYEEALQAVGIDVRSFIDLANLWLLAGDRPALDALYLRYTERKKSLLTQQLLGSFIRKHPGLRPACGAPLGGTYVLVHHGGGDGSVKPGRVTLSGRVLDGSDALAGVNVLSVGAGKGTLTDIDGNFRLEVSSLPTQLNVSYTGYPTRRTIIYTGAPIRIDLSQLVRQDAPFPGVAAGTVIADFYLPYRIGDGSAPTTIMAPAPAPKPTDPDPDPDPDTEEGDDDDDAKKLPFAGKAIRYRYPFMIQLPAAKSINYAECSIVLDRLSVVLDKDTLALSEDDRKAFNDKLASMWSGSVNQSGFSERMVLMNDALAELGDLLGKGDDRFTKIAPLKLSVEIEEGFQLLTVRHFGADGKGEATMQWTVKYQQTTKDAKLMNRRVCTYAQGQLSLSLPEINTFISQGRCKVETADFSVGEDFESVSTEALTGDVWTDPPSIGAQRLGRAVKAFIEIGPAKPSVTTLASHPDDIETKVEFGEVGKAAGKSLLRALLVDNSSGAFRVITKEYTA